MYRERARARAEAGDEKAWPVEVLLPDPLPVRLAEILAVERFFADLVDAALEPQKHAEPLAAIAGGQRAGSAGPGGPRPRAPRRVR